MKPILNFKDSYKMHVINSYRFEKDQPPIMSFQTSYTGTFAPVITPSLGTLVWEVDGIKQQTNTPSFELTGGVVDVNVYANNVAEGEYVTSIDMDALSIIGTIGLQYFTLNGDVDISSNEGVIDIVFRDAPNFITGTGLQVDGCRMPSLDVSYLTINANFIFQNNSSLTSLELGNNSHNIPVFRGTNCRLNSLDLKNTSISVLFQLGFNYNLSTFYKGNGTISVINFEIMQNNLTALDLTGVTISSLLYCYNNVNLSSISPPNYTSDFGDLRSYNTALSQASVDGIYSSLNTFFSSNTPIKNLSVRTDLGTNAIPTGGSSNIDIVNLDTVVYPNAGFDFIYAIN